MGESAKAVLALVMIVAATAAATGQFVLISPATVTVGLPSGVAKELPKQIPPTVQVFWQLGDRLPGDPKWRP